MEPSAHNHEVSESFLVITRIRNYIAAQGLKVADESVEELNRRVKLLIDQGIERTRSNKRLTLRPHDF